jgi:hypothetical protein
LAAHLIADDWILAESQMTNSGGLEEYCWSDVRGGRARRSGAAQNTVDEGSEAEQIAMPLCNNLDLGFCHSYDLADICAPQSDLNRISCSQF